MASAALGFVSSASCVSFDIDLDALMDEVAAEDDVAVGPPSPWVPFSKANVCNFKHVWSCVSAYTCGLGRTP